MRSLSGANDSSCLADFIGRVIGHSEVHRERPVGVEEPQQLLPYPTSQWAMGLVGWTEWGGAATLPGQLRALSRLRWASGVGGS